MLARVIASVVFVLAVSFAADPALAALEKEPAAEPHGMDLTAVDGVPRFELRPDEQGGSLLVLGLNVFTPQQLVQFVTALPEFLEGAARLGEGQTLVLRQAGVHGYVALSADWAEPLNRFTLTFHAEAPAAVANVAAVQGMGLEFLSMLLTQE